jgi:hypothetical protein
VDNRNSDASSKQNVHLSHEIFSTLT